jgi:carboxyl-terminal processing protease
MSTVRSARPALRAAALVAAVAVAYVGGVVTGVVGRGPAAANAQRGVIDEAADRIAADAAEPVNRKELERAAVEGMLGTLGDRWSTFYGPTEFASFQDALDGRYSGVGLWLRPLSGGGVQVGSVQRGSPAARAGMLTGDALLTVDARDVEKAGVGTVAGLLRGEENSTVRLVVRRAGARIEVSVKRETFSTHDVSVDRLRGGIVHVEVSAFTRGVGREVRAAMAANATQRSNGIVLDLRGNPGGLLDEAVEVASSFLDGGPVVSYERRGKAPRTLKALSGGDVTTPLVVLVDSATASAAEVVAAALQDRNRAVVVGSRTFGKGTVQEPSRLSDGSGLELTVGRYLTPSGRTIEGVGLEPDVAVPATEPAAVAERRAIEVLTGLVAALDGTGRG